jgi:hypothetical protein
MAEPTELNDYQRQQLAIHDFYNGYAPPERASHHTIALEWNTIVEGEDDNGDYDSTMAYVVPQAVMEALLDALPTSDNPFEQTPSFTLEVDGVTVKVEWSRARLVPDLPIG